GQRGLSAPGSVGDSDPALAAQDALREQPADEVVIVERAPQQERWFEHGLFERAKEEIEPPLKLVLVDHDGAPDHVVAVERAPGGLEEGSRDAGGTVEISEN